MTMDEIRASGKETLSPADVAGVLGCNPYSINIQARQDPSRLGFPVVMIGTRVRIPRAAFIRHIDGGIAALSEGTHLIRP